MCYINYSSNNTQDMELIPNQSQNPSLIPICRLDI